MKLPVRLHTLLPAALASALLVAPVFAQCGGFAATAKPAALSLSNRAAARLVRTALNDHDGDRYNDPEPIVGMWHIKYISQGSGAVAPDGAEIDAGYQQWHSDGTEILNSGGRPPSTSNFCMGVWKKVGDREYRLNHFAIAWDPTGTKLLGPAQFQEDVVVGPAGHRFKGTFTIDQFDEAGTVLAHLQGVVHGTRITIETPFESIF